MTDRHSSSQEEKEGQRYWWRMTECVLSNSKIRADLLFLFWDAALSGPALPRLKQYQCLAMHVCDLDVLPCRMFPFSLLSKMKQNRNWKPWMPSPNWLGYSVVALSHCSTLKLRDAVAAACKYDCRFCLCGVCLCGCSHSSVFPPLSYSSSLDPRQTEGAPLHRGTSPPPCSRLPAVLMVGLWGPGYKGSRDEEERLWFVLSSSFQVNPGTLGDRC